MFFRGLLNKIKKRRPMLASRMGGFLRQRPQLMERMRNLRGMRGMGRNMMMPGMGIGSLPNMPSRDVNDLPLPYRSSDIMPRNGMMPKQQTRLAMATQMPGVPPRGSGPPPMPNPMMDMQGRRFMANGGEVDPNPGITALRKEAPEVVEAMGYAPGGEVTPGFFGDPKARNLYKALIEQGYSPAEAEKIANNRLKEANMKKIFDRSEADAQKRMDKSSKKNLKMLGRLGRVGLGGGIAGLGLLALDPDVRSAVGRFPQYQDPFEGVVPYGISKFTPDMYQLSNFLTSELAGRPDRAFNLPDLKKNMEAAIEAGEPTFEYRFKPYNTEEVLDFFNNQ